MYANNHSKKIQWKRGPHLFLTEMSQHYQDVRCPYANLWTKRDLSKNTTNFSVGRGRSSRGKETFTWEVDAGNRRAGGTRPLGRRRAAGAGGTGRRGRTRSSGPHWTACRNPRAPDGCTALWERHRKSWQTPCNLGVGTSVRRQWKERPTDHHCQHPKARIFCKA